MRRADRSVRSAGSASLHPVVVPIAPNLILVQEPAQVNLDETERDVPIAPNLILVQEPAQINLDETERDANMIQANTRPSFC
jgi:hypothetical protein